MRASTPRLVLLGIVLGAVGTATSTMASVSAVPTGVTLPYTIPVGQELLLTFPGDGVTYGEDGLDIYLDFECDMDVELLVGLRSVDDVFMGYLDPPLLFSQYISIKDLVDAYGPVGYVAVRAQLGDVTLKAVEGYYPVGVISVNIDIKPGSSPNTVSLGANGVIPVAILSSVDFDALTVDVATVQLEGKAGVRVKGNGAALTEQRDVNGDGLVDLVVKIETENLEPGDLQDGQADVTGQTTGGLSFIGTDLVIIVPPQ
jgi:hypothetical protein